MTNSSVATVMDQNLDSNSTPAEMNHGYIHHMLVKNLKNKSGRSSDLACFLCYRINQKAKKTIYGCIQCRKAFHVECFTAFHFRHQMTGQTKTIMDLLERNDARKMDPTNWKACTKVGNLESITIGES